MFKCHLLKGFIFCFIFGSWISLSFSKHNRKNGYRFLELRQLILINLNANGFSCYKTIIKT